MIPHTKASELRKKKRARDVDHTKSLQQPVENRQSKQETVIMRKMGQV